MTHTQPLRQTFFKETGNHFKLLFCSITDMKSAQYQLQ